MSRKRDEQPDLPWDIDPPPSRAAPAHPAPPADTTLDLDLGPPVASTPRPVTPAAIPVEVDKLVEAAAPTEAALPPVDFAPPWDVDPEPAPAQITPDTPAPELVEQAPPAPRDLGSSAEPEADLLIAVAKLIRPAAFADSDEVLTKTFAAWQREERRRLEPIARAIVKAVRQAGV